MWRALGALVMIWSTAAGAGVEVEPGVSEALAQQRAAVLSALRYELRLAIPGERGSPIEGELGIDFSYAADGQDLQLDFRESAEHLHSLSVNGESLEIDLRHEHLVLPHASLRPGANRVDIRFTAGDSSLNRREDFLYTLFVPDRARTAFPLFDQPDLKGTIALTLDLPGAWTGLSNAPLASKQVQEDFTRWRFARTEPISSYLFSFVAGRFDTVTREVGGRPMTLLHRETDTAKLERNLDAIFELHGSALAWMEEYTGIPLPYSKLDFALIPDFQYGGMEHTGAIQYRASSLLLESGPTLAQLLDRARLIAHEVAHMWFGNLVTMRWFNDVWTKEVFANFMAAKMVNPAFPDIDHELSFLVRHYPGAYGVDRTAGANPIRQQLDNLALAGQMYGPIIYLKAPIMMRQLELVIGEEAFRGGMREYLQTFAHGNATWPDLVAILDRRTETDLNAWSNVWVNTPGRPRFLLEPASPVQLQQQDPAGLGRIWPQQFSVRTQAGARRTVHADRMRVPLAGAGAHQLINSDGRGYGLFPAELSQLAHWPALGDLERGSLLLYLYENVLEGTVPAGPYLQALVEVIDGQPGALLLDLALAQLQRIHTSLLPESERTEIQSQLEAVLWRAVEADSDNRRQLYEAYAEIASSPAALKRLESLWSGTLSLEGLTLSERDRIRLTELLAIREPGRAKALVERQLQVIDNPDERRRLEFLAPSLAADPAIRDRFFASLAREENRETESWVLDALANLHHPSRRDHAVGYLPDSLALLEEIQVTGDIFFPTRWLEANFGNHNSPRAVEIAQAFLAGRPNYNAQLRMKILQAVDLPARAVRILAAGG